MGFDGKAFFQSYLEGKTKQRTDSKDRATTERDRLEKSRPQLIALAKKKDELKGAARTTVSRLESYGATSDMIKAAVAEGPTGLSDLETALSKVVANKGLEFAKANVDAIAGITLDAKLTNVSVDALIDQTYGGAIDYKLGDYEGAQDLNWWQKLSGEGAMSDMRKELDKTSVYDGKSLYDLDDYANSAAYNQVGGESFLTYNQPKFFGVGNVGNARIEINAVIGDNNALNVNLAQAKKLRDDIEGAESLLSAAEAPTNREEVIKTLANNKALLEANLTQRKDILDREIKPFLDTQVAGYYEDTYMDLMGTSIDGYVGLPGYHNSFRSDVVESGIPDTIKDGNNNKKIEKVELGENGLRLSDSSLESKDSAGNVIITNSDFTLVPIEGSTNLHMFKAANGDVHLFDLKDDIIYSVQQTKSFLNSSEIPNKVKDSIIKFSGVSDSVEKTPMQEAMSTITFGDWEKKIKIINSKSRVIKESKKKELREELEALGLPLSIEQMKNAGGKSLFKKGNTSTNEELSDEAFVPRQVRRK
tara:strand:+ start:1574 stop:3172 length:1599 start_codon:yes stop_codon:yes gene_type:complete